MSLFFALVLLAASWWTVTRLLQWLVTRAAEELPASKQLRNNSKILARVSAESRR